MFVGEIGQGHSAHPLHDQAQHHVVGVGVLIIRAGREVEGALRRQQFQIAGDIQNLRRAAGGFEQREDVPQSAGVMQEVGDGHIVGQRWQFGDESPHRILQPHPATVHQKKKRRRSELLADGGHMEGRSGGDGRFRFEIRHAESAAINQLAVLDHSHGTTGSVLNVKRSQQTVHGIRPVVGNERAADQQKCERQPGSAIPPTQEHLPAIIQCGHAEGYLFYVGETERARYGAIKVLGTPHEAATVTGGATD